MTDKPATYSGVSGAGVVRQGWHRQKKEVRQLAAGEEVFTIAEVEGLGFKGVKKFAEEQGLLREGRYVIPGRAKIKRMNYVELDGLKLIIAHFRQLQGGATLKEVSRSLEKAGNRKMAQRVRELQEGKP